MLVFRLAHSLGPSLGLRETTTFTVHENGLTAFLELTIIPGLGEVLANILIGPGFTARGAMGILNGSGDVMLDTAHTRRFRAGGGTMGT
jgi:hypothetical protein